MISQKKKTALLWQSGLRVDALRGSGLLIQEVGTAYALPNFLRSAPASPIRPVPMNIRLLGSGVAL